MGITKTLEQEVMSHRVRNCKDTGNTVVKSFTSLRPGTDITLYPPDVYQEASRQIPDYICIFTSTQSSFAYKLTAQ